MISVLNRVENMVGKEKKNLLNPFLGNKLLDSSKLKGFAGDNGKFDENGRKFFKS